MPEMKELYGETAIVSEELGIVPDLATELSEEVNKAWNEEEIVRDVVRKLKLSGKKAYVAYCLGRVVEKNKRGDFKR